MNDALAKLYQEVIVAHHRAPRNRGPLADATHETTIDNPLCGDQVILRLRLEDGRVAKLAFEARGCMLSVAAASLMTGAIDGVTVDEARALAARFQDFLAASGSGDGLGELTALAGVREFPSRLGCVKLPWQALAKLTG